MQNSTPLGGAARRRKGHQFERDVAIMLRAYWPEAKRGIQARGGTKEAPDVDGTPWYIECKRGRNTSPKAAYRQALAATDGRPALAVTKDDGCPELVTMSLVDWINLVDRINELEFSAEDARYVEATT